MSTTYATALRAARSALAAHSESPALDAELLLAEACGQPRARVIAWPDRELDPAQAARLRALVTRRAAGVPLAYLTGRRDFWSLELAVTPAVLVPRPETELLVELALAALAPLTAPSVLDLGTGSGAIALALAHERPDARVTAVDLSEAALAIARGNAQRCGLGRVEFLCGNWFAPVSDRRFGLVVSNPPYLAEDDPHWPGLVHEPRAALAAGRDGLDALRAISADAGRHLLPGALLLLEHGAGQAAAVRGLLEEAGLQAITTHRDLAGLERVTGGALQ